jgi:hypothetical protein
MMMDMESLRQKFCLKWIILGGTMIKAKVYE